MNTFSYANMYCALCNGVMTENIKFWKAVTDCSWEETILFNDEGEELPDKERTWFGCFYIYGYNISYKGSQFFNPRRVEFLYASDHWF